MGMPPNRSPQNLLVRLSADTMTAFYKAGHWTDETIYSLAARHAARTPDRTAIRDSFCALNYRDLLALADMVAGDLTRSGLGAGDRVAAWLSNRVEMAVFLLACSRNGFVFCPSLHRNHTAEEVGTLLQRVDAKAIVTEAGFGATEDGDAVARALSIDSIVRHYRLPPPEARDATRIVELLDLAKSISTSPTGLANDVVYLAFTSGTTGEPKGVMHSNNTLLANARAIAADWCFDAGSGIYTLSPLSHNLGFGALVLTMLVGGEIVLHDLGKGASLLARLGETGASFIFGVPAHAIDLLDELDRHGAAGLKNLKGFRISGAAVPPVVVEKLLGHGIKPQSGYGMTEACSHHYTLPDDAAALIVGTSGRACPGYEVSIFSPEDPDRTLGAGEVGHIGGRGASLMLGYFDNQRATEASFNKSGWFMTGDLGRLDEQGYLVITGRIKDVIIRGGHNIYPAKIETLAMRHPDIERAAAIPVKDERLGEKVCIVVMPKNGSHIDPQVLLSHLHSQGLSKYDMPEFFLEVIEIPLSASGKILKRALMPEVANGSLKPVPVRWHA